MMHNFIFTSGSNTILLSVETCHGLYLYETISTVGIICDEVKFLLSLCFFAEGFVITFIFLLFTWLFIDQFSI